MPVKIFEALKDFGGREAIHDSLRGGISYSELADESDALFSSEESMKSVALFLGANDAETVIVYVGMLRNAIVPIMLDPNSSVEYIDKLLVTYKPKWIFMQKSPDLSLSEYFIFLSLNSYNLYQRKIPVETRICQELSLLLPTSGSTGSPKLVRLSHSNLVQNSLSISQALPMLPLDATITTLPINYSYGLSILHSHLLVGGLVYLNKHSIIQREFWDIVRRNKICSFGGVPYSYQMLFRLGKSVFEGTSIRYLTQAGGALEVNLVKHFHEISKEFGFAFYVMYGQTEATARMAVLDSKSLPMKIGSVGRSIPGGKFFVRGLNGEYFETSKLPGELIYKGRNVCMGYAHDIADLERGDDNMGELSTGDLGEIDEHGFVFIRGRVNRISKVRGVRIQLEDIEKALNDTGSQFVCLEVNETIYICSTGEADSSTAESLLSEKFNFRKSDYSLITIPSFPRSISGKISYKELRNYILTGQFQMDEHLAEE
jgi:long-chain acyl-CoA synthetase